MSWIHPIKVTAAAAFFMLAHPARSGDDPVGENLFPPEMIMRSADAVGLTDTQRGELRAIIEEFQAGEATDPTAGLVAAREALANALGGDGTIDEAAALDSLDALLESERTVKSRHVRVMLRIRNVLTPEQVAKLREMRSAGHGVGTPEERAKLEARLTGKVKNIEQMAEHLTLTGAPPFEVIERMQAFPDLMRDGKMQEAEALLDQVTRELEAMTEAEGNGEPGKGANALPTGSRYRGAAATSPVASASPPGGLVADAQQPRPAPPGGP